MSPLRVRPGSDPRRGSCTKDSDRELLTVGDFLLHSCEVDVSSLLKESPRGRGSGFLDNTLILKQIAMLTSVAFHSRIRCLTNCQEERLSLTQCQTFLWQGLSRIVTLFAGFPLLLVCSFPECALPHHKAEVGSLTSGNQMCYSVPTHRNASPPSTPSRKGLHANLPPQYWEPSPGKQGKNFSCKLPQGLDREEQF